MLSEKDTLRRYEISMHSTKKKRKKKKKVVVSKKIIINSLLQELVFLSEAQFAAWFEKNYNLFGILKILNIGTWFPDVYAQLPDNSKIRIELEYHANNFKAHRHDPNGCDLIISYLKSHKQTTIKGKPLISIFNVSGNISKGYDLTNRELTDFFIECNKNTNRLTEILREHTTTIAERLGLE